MGNSIACILNLSNIGWRRNMIGTSYIRRRGYGLSPKNVSPVHPFPPIFDGRTVRGQGAGWQRKAAPSWASSYAARCAADMVSKGLRLGDMRTCGQAIATVRTASVCGAYNV